MLDQWCQFRIFCTRNSDFLHPKWLCRCATVSDFWHPIRIWIFCSQSHCDFGYFAPEFRCSRIQRFGYFAPENFGFFAEKIRNPRQDGGLHFGLCGFGYFDPKISANLQAKSETFRIYCTRNFRISGYLHDPNKELYSDHGNTETKPGSCPFKM